AGEAGPPRGLDTKLEVGAAQGSARVATRSGGAWSAWLRVHFVQPMSVVIESAPARAAIARRRPSLCTARCHPATSSKSASPRTAHASRDVQNAAPAPRATNATRPAAAGSQRTDPKPPRGGVEESVACVWRPTPRCYLDTVATS